MTGTKKRSVRAEQTELNLPRSISDDLRSKGGIEWLISVVPQRGYLNYQADQFHSLSDPIRLQIMHALKQGDMCPCILKKVTELSDSKLSYHLGKLESAGLIVSRQEKNWRVYSLTANGRSFLT